MSAAERKAATRKLAREQGFVACGVVPVGPTPHADAFRAWIEAGLHADMDYLARNIDKRVDPARLVAGARSVICLAMSYAPPPDAETTDAFVARYARGRDYHKVLKKRCHAIMDALRAGRPEFAGRAFVDTAPVCERDLAAAAGIGWIGRNGCLIVPGVGSYVVLAEIVCNLPLPADDPHPNDCGDCGLCLAACPTRAFQADRTIDARRCLSYQTIENRAAIPEWIRPRAGARVFGCDTCQQACPHNHDIPPGDAELTAAGRAPLDGATLADILRWTWDDWDAATCGRTSRRATYEMFLRNAAIAAGGSGDRVFEPLLSLLADAGEPVGNAARWALGRLRSERPDATVD